MAHTGNIGTTLWMAPELFEPNPKYDYSVDSKDNIPIHFFCLQAPTLFLVWSFGMILVELITLEAPYGQGNQLQILEKIKQGIPPDLSKYEGPLYKNIIALIRNCLVKNPSQRPSARQIFISIQDLSMNLEVEDFQ